MSIIKIGFNPNLYHDIKTILELTMDEYEIKKFVMQLDEKDKINKLSYCDKLISFIDKMEFIDHLNYVKKEAIHKKFIIGGHEVRGLDNDLDALRLYLTISCIEIVAKMQPHHTFENWLIKCLKKCDDFERETLLRGYMIRKKDEYYNEFGMHSNFRKVF